MLNSLKNIFKQSENEIQENNSKKQLSLLCGLMLEAAQVDGKGSGTLDMTGLAQKGGAVKTYLEFLIIQKKLVQLDFLIMTQTYY